MLEDRRLTWRFKNGGRQALGQIYEKYESLLLTIAGAILNDASAAEDVVQDVFLKLAQHPEALRLSGNLRNYLAICTANLSKDRLRSRRQVLRRDAVVADALDRLDPMTEALRLEQAQALWQALVRGKAPWMTISTDSSVETIGSSSMPTWLRRSPSVIGA